MDWTTTLLEQIAAFSITEVIAVVLSIAYVWLASKQSIWCWPCALVSTALYTMVFWNVDYVFQMLLNVYYMAMAVVGFLSWRQGSDSAEELQVSRMGLFEIGVFLSLGILCTFVVLAIANNWLSYDLLWLDTGIAIFSLLTTYLTVRKKLESWVFWTLINGFSIHLYLQVPMYPSVLLMVIYMVIAIKGFIEWRASYQLVYQSSEVGAVE